MTALHDPNVLPAELPAPQDDGAARHLAGMRLPSLALAATDGSNVDLSKLSGRTVVYVYPRTGVPGQPLPEGWNEIPGARGCTPQSCGFRDHFGELKLHLPFPVLSDERLALARALDLPTFTTSGMTLLKRMALIIDDGVISKVFYPVFPPDKNAEEVIAWLRE
jgi:peroxiredoxin